MTRDLRHEYRPQPMRLTLLLLGLVLFASPAAAVDGVIEINQARALAGGITATDTPGFPVTLDTGGSYRLTSSLINPNAAVSTVEMRASLTTLDLNGFAVIGPLSGCTWNAGSGVACNNFGAGKGIDGGIGCPFGNTVRNGIVYNAANSGVELCAASRVENVQVLGAFGTGIKVSESGIVRDCTVVMAYVAGIRAESGLVEDSTVRDTGSSANGAFSFGADGLGSTVATRNLVLQRIWNAQYFRNGRSLGASLCDGVVC